MNDFPEDPATRRRRIVEQRAANAARRARLIAELKAHMARRETHQSHGGVPHAEFLLGWDGKTLRPPALSEPPGESPDRSVPDPMDAMEPRVSAADLAKIDAEMDAAFERNVAKSKAEREERRKLRASPPVEFAKRATAAAVEALRAAAEQAEQSSKATVAEEAERKQAKPNKQVATAFGRKLAEAIVEGLQRTHPPMENQEEPVAPPTEFMQRFTAAFVTSLRSVAEEAKQPSTVTTMPPREYGKLVANALASALTAAVAEQATKQRPEKLMAKPPPRETLLREIAARMRDGESLGDAADAVLKARRLTRLPPPPMPPLATIKQMLARKGRNADQD